MEIPQDMVFEIFSWLPAKSIWRFKSTCISCSIFPKETLFRAKQTRNLSGADGFVKESESIGIKGEISSCYRVYGDERNVYSCDLGDEKFMMVEEIGQHNCGLHPRFISYSGTLCSCGTNARDMSC
ncbi:unnamed protein product [Vicia faba]|uniref:F-box domain-containing protein n=1 Tax=Vicia faba TaxID=3906 RepID=A0AAV0YU48_VICFA|nr:unnamed protein product [Vicia faba]